LIELKQDLNSLFGRASFGKTAHTFPDALLLFGRASFGKTAHTFPDALLLFGRASFGKTAHTFPRCALVVWWRFFWENRSHFSWKRSCCLVALLSG
jgi:hypothetical protein